MDLEQSVHEGREGTVPAEFAALGDEGNGLAADVCEKLRRMAVEGIHDVEDRHALGGREPLRGDGHGDLAEGERGVSFKGVALDLFEHQFALADVGGEHGAGGGTNRVESVHGCIVPVRGACVNQRTARISSS